MKKNHWLLLAAAVLLIALAACGGADGGAAAAQAGETLFSQPIIGTQPGCITCHSLTPDEVVVGPSLAGVGSRAESRVEGKNAEEYLRQSILEPNAYLVDGFEPNVMVQVWEDELSAEQVDQLIAFLLTLK